MWTESLTLDWHASISEKQFRPSLDKGLRRPPGGDDHGLLATRVTTQTRASTVGQTEKEIAASALFRRQPYGRQH